MAKVEFVKFRTTSKFKEELLLAASEAGFKSTTEYLIYLVDEAAKDPSVQKVDNTLSDSFNWHLSRIGNNLNQLAYNINKANLKNNVDNELAKEITKELMYLNVQLNQLNKKRS